MQFKKVTIRWLFKPWKIKAIWNRYWNTEKCLRDRALGMNRQRCEMRCTLTVQFFREKQECLTQSWHREGPDCLAASDFSFSCLDTLSLPSFHWYYRRLKQVPQLIWTLVPGGHRVIPPSQVVAMSILGWGCCSSLWSSKEAVIWSCPSSGSYVHPPTPSDTQGVVLNTSLCLWAAFLIELSVLGTGKEREQDKLVKKEYWVQKYWVTKIE